MAAVSVLKLNADLQLGLNRTLYGDTSLSLDCQTINLGRSDGSQTEIGRAHV